MTSQAYYDAIMDDPEIMHNAAILAEDLETTTEVVERYLNSSPKRIFIGSGDIETWNFSGIQR